jgi:hypothetical protein
LQCFNVDPVEIKEAHLPVRKLPFVYLSLEQNIYGGVSLVFLDVRKGFSDDLFRALP